MNPSLQGPADSVLVHDLKLLLQALQQVQVQRFRGQVKAAHIYR